MSDAPIQLEKVTNIGQLQSKFSTAPDISRKLIKTFFDDASRILKKIDTNVNYDSGMFNHYDSLWHILVFNPSITEKHLQVRTGAPTQINSENIVTSHCIEYRKKPQGCSQWTKERLQDNTLAHHLIYTHTLMISTTKPTYKPQTLIDAITDLPYIGLSSKYNGTVFDLDEVIKAYENPKSKLTSTGTVLRSI